VELGRIGIWTVALDALAPRAAQEAAAELDELGYGALWFGEAYGREALTHAALLLAGTRRMTVATGIASIYARDAMATNAASRTLHALHPGRFVLGLGVSHAPLVERFRGQDYGRPLSAMRAYLDALDGAAYLAGGGPEAEPAPPRVLAALGPKMLDLARERAAGAHPYLVTPEHTRQARERLGPDAVLAVEQAVALTEDEAEFRRRAHAHLEIYTGLPNYRGNWLRLGFDDTDLVRGGSERLVDALVGWGDEERALRLAGEHLEAGASHVCLQVLGPETFVPPREDWRRLAPAALAL
jgi:probable F420-dependent oxidoreductase